MMTTGRKFYAFSWTYGAGMTDGDTGRALGTLHAFESRVVRDSWVADGSAYVTSPRYREAVTARALPTGVRLADAQPAD